MLKLIRFLKHGTANGSLPFQDFFSLSRGLNASARAIGLPWSLQGQIDHIFILMNMPIHSFHLQV